MSVNTQWSCVKGNVDTVQLVIGRTIILVLVFQIICIQLVFVSIISVFM